MKSLIKFSYITQQQKGKDFLSRFANFGTAIYYYKSCFKRRSFIKYVYSHYMRVYNIYNKKDNDAQNYLFFLQTDLIKYYILHLKTKQL